MEIKRFLEKVASATPTPGGGSASALAGALSASLVAMVAGLSPKQKRLEGMKKRALTIQRRLFQAMAEDAESFDAVMRAYRLPKHTEKDRLVRAKAIQEAYRKAIPPPRLVCQESIELLEYSYHLILKGNPNAISDAGVAAFLADAALKGGLVNVSINLGRIRDELFRKKMQSFSVKLEKKRSQIMTKIQKALSKSLLI
jgi:formiminotetrahydrofolate cyclodeaminase